MDLKEAAESAREYVSDLFASEEITNIGLEEVEFDEMAAVWKITLSFSRPWQRQGNLGANLGLKAVRSCKVIHIDGDGHVKSVKDRVLPAIAN